MQLFTRRWLLTCVLCVAHGAAFADKPATKPAADAHFIEADDWFFVGIGDEGKGTINLGKKRDKPPENGAQQFVTTWHGGIVDAKIFFQTRIAKPEDLYVGRTILFPRVKKIESAEDKQGASVWSYRQIVNVGDAPKGKVIVTGVGARTLADIDQLRVPVGTPPEAEIKLTGKEDAHAFHPEHWLVYDGTDTPDPTGHDTRMALAIKAPPKPGEPGTFLVLSNGRLVTTKHAYKSRVATKADLKTGLRIGFSTSRGSEAPKRDESYEGLWWVGNITSYENNVIKIGNRSVRVEPMRVITP